MNSHGEIERNRVRNEENRDLHLNRHLSNSRQLRCREVSRKLSRKVSRKKPSTNAGIERYREARRISDTRSSIDPQGIETGVEKEDTNSTSESRSIQQVSRIYRQDRRNLDRSIRCRGGVEIAIRNNMRSSTDDQVSRRCRGRCRAHRKRQFFQK